MKNKLCRRSVCLIASVLLLLAACRGPEAYPVPELIEPAGLSAGTAEVRRGDVTLEETFSGVLSPDYTELCFDTDGTVGEIFAYTGDFVHAGDPIVRLEASGNEAMIEGLEAEIGREEAKAVNAEAMAALRAEYSELEYGELVLSEGEASVSARLKAIEIEEEALETRAASEASLKRLDALAAELSGLQTEKGRMTLTAPHDGYLCLDAEIRVGSPVKTGHTACTVINAEALRFTVPGYLTERDAPDGDTAVYMNGAAYGAVLMPMSSDEYTARLTAGKTIFSCFSVEDPEGTLTAGTPGILTIRRDSRENVLTVPQNAVLSDGQGAYVYVIEDGMKIRRGIETGLSDGTLTEVVSGLREQESVFVEALTPKTQGSGQTATVTRGSLSHTVRVMGTTCYPRMAEVSYAGEEAEVIEVLKAFGDEVKQGDAILEITVPVSEADLMEAELRLSDAENALEKTKADYESRIAERKNAAEAAADPTACRKAEIEAELLEKTYETWLPDAEAEIEALKAAADSEKLKRGHCFIEAPIDGTVDSVILWNAGDILPQGAFITTVTDREKACIAVDTPDFNFNQTVAVIPRFDGGKTEYAGQVILSSSVLPDAGFEGALIRVDDAPDLFGVAEVNVRGEDLHIDNVLLVPDGALYKENGHTFVIAVSEDGTMQPKPVKVLYSDGTSSWVSQGVSEGEKVLLP